ncbi:S9 family peptidase [Formosa sediminum]|uniref:prolyl oligopeptidase n=1 Tax=Formosa sediminum TaxID=2594004 RepID=A0A516GQ50_9FLAO|nr:prolyl oligopeptidase family serine peptidase [Formosa sediminum]QDO93632.1 S9 family peptidase [Formosa sediminum]
MFKFTYCLVLFFTLSLTSFAQKANQYQAAPKAATEDVYFDTVISDPYQWMENPKDPRLSIWMEAQDKFTSKIKNKYLKTIDLKAQLSAMYYGVKNKEVDRFTQKDSSLSGKYEFKFKVQNSNSNPNLLYRLRDRGNFLTLVDTKDYMEDRDDNILIRNYYVNEDYDILAVTLSHRGGDWQELYFFNLKNGQQLHGSLKNLRIGSQVIWDKMNLYYDAYTPPKAGQELLDRAEGQKLYYHKFGDSQDQDVVVLTSSDSSGVNTFRFKELDDKLFFNNIYKHKGKSYNALAVAKKDSIYLNLNNFLIYPKDEEITVNVEDAFGDKVVLYTNWGAPNGRVLLSDLSVPNKPIELVPEYDVRLLEVNRLGKDKIVCIYKNGNRDLALFFDLEGKLLNKIDFPEGKRVKGLYEYNEDATKTNFYVSSFYHPDLEYELSLKDLSFKPSVAVSVPYDPESLETRYVKYKSKDGTEIPMYITCLKDTKLNGKNPTLLYGYGGYGITVAPAFDESKALWLLHGGILAIPNVRGGGAGGSDWGKAGRRINKQNAIDDFIAAGEYLIAQNYTSPQHLGSNGGSHGGLLVSSAALQRPDLFNAVVAEAGPYDMLRFGKYTVGSVTTNIEEFGAVTDLNDFNNLISYSPLHNINAGVKYPNFLVMTGDSDDRVPPLHTYKFLATLQEKANPTSLYLMYVTPGKGHGSALTTNDWFDEVLYKYAFLYHFLKD